jgi:nicotinate-nucleotide pyrophosphorylase (carboxylating)
MQIEKNYLKLSEPLIKLALDEDIKTGDITTESITPLQRNASGVIISKDEGVICGLDVFVYVFEHYGGNKIVWKPLKKDGDPVENGETIAEFFAPYNTILTAERTALNFLQRMSGVATLTNQFVKKLEGTNTKLLDTRKTLPGFRHLDKYAVLTGGGSNHRFGLYDMIMIKDNHIEMSGSIRKAVEQVKNKYGDRFIIEVETRNLDDVKEALASEADIIMLDNMSINAMKECVEFIGSRVKTEASGNVNINNIHQIALTGVDFISVGSITHSAKAFDISLLIQ